MFTLTWNFTDHLHLAFSYTQQVASAPILCFANKQDVAGSMSPSEVSEALALTSLPVSWHIQGCSALTGKGYVRTKCQLCCRR